MQMIFKSAGFLSRPLVGIVCIYCASEMNSHSFKKVPQVHDVQHPRVPQLVLFLGILCIASKMHAIPIERNTFHFHQWV